jgi:hypothetical protein
MKNSVQSIVHTLIIPPAAQGAEQMSSVNVKATKEIANLRIHVELLIL